MLPLVYMLPSLLRTRREHQTLRSGRINLQFRYLCSECHESWIRSAMSLALAPNLRLKIAGGVGDRGLTSTRS